MALNAIIVTLGANATSAIKMYACKESIYDLL
jgi:hypothetical protein